MECRLKAKKCGGCPMLGLDYAEQYRNLPYIGVLKPEIYGN